MKNSKNASLLQVSPQHSFLISLSNEITVHLGHNEASDDDCVAYGPRHHLSSIFNSVTTCRSCTQGSLKAVNTTDWNNKSNLDTNLQHCQLAQTKYHANVGKYCTKL